MSSRHKFAVGVSSEGWPPKRASQRSMTSGFTMFSVVGSLPSTASGRQTVGENLAQIDFSLPEGTSAAEEEAAIQRVRDVFATFPNVEPELVHPSVMSMKPPVEVLLVFEDGSQVRKRWDGQYRWTRLVEEGPSKLVYAEVDPDRVLLLDSDSLVLADPYPALRSHFAAYAAIGLHDQSAGPAINVNGGTWYLRGAPGGPEPSIMSASTAPSPTVPNATGTFRLRCCHSSADVTTLSSFSPFGTSTAKRSARPKGLVSSTSNQQVVPNLG